MFFEISFLWWKHSHKYCQMMMLCSTYIYIYLYIYIYPTDTSQETEDRAKFQRGWLGSQGICGWRSLMPLIYLDLVCMRCSKWRYLGKLQAIFTPRKLNVAPENRPSQQESSLPTNHHFSELCYINFGGVLEGVHLVLSVVADQLGTISMCLAWWMWIWRRNT